MNDFFECNLTTYTWRQIACVGTVPSPRYFHACAMYNNAMYTFGGYNGTERLNDMCVTVGERASERERARASACECERARASSFPPLSGVDAALSP